MSRDFDPPVDHALDELLDAAASAPDDERESPPGFADVLSRLSDAPTPGLRLGPAHVGEDEELDDGPDDVLATLIDAAREEAEVDARQHLRPTAPLRRPGRRVAAVAGISLAAAAAAVLAFGVANWSGLAARGDSDETKEAAASQLERDRRLRQATPGQVNVEPEPAPRPVTRKRAPVPEAEPELEAPQVPEQIAPLETVEPTAAKAEADVAPHRPTRRTVAARLAELDGRAQAQLAEGDTAGANRTLRKLISTGGRRSVVQLAYGDLFTLAHRGGKPAQQRTLWREYLAKFPKGRFADDARSGLCRHADETTRQACWTDYLHDFPKGSYRSQAARVVAKAEAP